MAYRRVEGGKVPAAAVEELRKGCVMACYVGLDASKQSTKICVLNESGEVIQQGSVDTDPRAIAGFLRGHRRRYARVGMEAWSLAPWLYVGLAKAGLPIICIEARHAHGVLKAMRTNKTDQNDARGIAEIVRAGLYRIVHVKSLESRRIGALLTTRKLLINKAVDLENGVRGLLLAQGLKLMTGARTTFDARVLRLIAADTHLREAINPLLSLRRLALGEFEVCTAHLQTLADHDPVCRRLMSAPGVGPITALSFRVAVDEPARFARSRDVGPYIGLTSAVSQSGETLRTGRISKRGDKELRSLLFTCARYQFRKACKPSWLRTWALGVAARRGKLKAHVAVARRLAVTLHRMWITESDFRWEMASAADPRPLVF